MKFITVATNSSPHLERLLRSCRHYEIPLEVLGSGRPYPHHGIKSQYILEYLPTLPDDEIVLFVDGYDVVFLTGADEIEEKFRAFEHPFVISTEQNCNVDGGLRVRFSTWLKFPKGKKPYRFINTGSYVGRAGYLRTLLESLRIQPTDSDQTIMNRHFVANPDMVRLDYDHQVFTCTAGRTGLELEDYRVENGRLRNVVTGSLPCILHCPGKNYLGLERLVERLPIAGPPYEPSAEERRNYRKSQFVNRVNARLLPDNFLFHLILDGLLLLMAAAVVSALLLALF
jgi:hypothetical protein